MDAQKETGTWREVQEGGQDGDGMVNAAPTHTSSLSQPLLPAPAVTAAHFCPMGRKTNTAADNQTNVGSSVLGWKLQLMS